MSVLKTFVCAAVFCAAQAPAAQASDSLAKTFAGCVGRFSAQMEHAWLMGDAAAETHEAHRNTFLTLMDATQGLETPRHLLAHRIESKLAQSALLTQATFSDSARHKSAAQRRALQHLTICRSLLLGG